MCLVIRNFQVGLNEKHVYKNTGQYESTCSKCLFSDRVFWERQILKAKTYVKECMWDKEMTILPQMGSLYGGIVIGRIN